MIAPRTFDGPDLHTPVVIAVSRPTSQALEVADAVTFVLSPDDYRAESTNRLRDSLVILPSDPAASAEDIQLSRSWCLLSSTRMS